MARRAGDARWWRLPRLGRRRRPLPRSRGDSRGHGGSHRRNRARRGRGLRPAPCAPRYATGWASSRRADIRDGEHQARQALLHSPVPGRTGGPRSRRAAGVAASVLVWTKSGSPDALAVRPVLGFRVTVEAIGVLVVTVAFSHTKGSARLRGPQAPARPQPVRYSRANSRWH